MKKIFKYIPMMLAVFAQFSGNESGDYHQGRCR